MRTTSLIHHSAFLFLAVILGALFYMLASNVAAQAPISTPKEFAVQDFQLSAQEQAWLKAHPVIRFSGHAHDFPFEHFNQQGEYIGLTADYLKLLEQKLGIKLEVSRHTSSTEALEQLKAGKIDLFSVSDSLPLAPEVLLTHRYFSNSIVVIMHGGADYVDEIEEVELLKIGIIQNETYAPEIIKTHSNLDFIDMGTVQNGLIKVSTGDLEVLVIGLAEAKHYIAELKLKNIGIVGGTRFKSELRFAVNKELAPLLPLFNRALASIDKNTHKNIKQQQKRTLRQTSREIVHLLSQKNALMLFAVFSMLIAIFSYWNRRLRKDVIQRKDAVEQTQSLIDTIPLHILVTTYEGRILSVNKNVVNDYKLYEADMNTLQIADFYYDPEERASVLDEFKANGKVEQRVVKFKRPNNKVQPMMVSMLPFTYNEKEALLTISVNINERLKSETVIKSEKESAEKAQHSAEQASLVKSEFFANMSKEIRTPLSAVIGFAELLNEQLDDPKLKDLSTTIQKAGKQSLTLINDISALNQLEAGTFKIEKSKHNPHLIFAEIQHTFRSQIKEKEIDLILDIDTTIPKHLLLDADRLRQVVGYLVENALKFTEKGAITLKVRSFNDTYNKLELLIAVEDTGVGIEVAQKELIQQNFEQVGHQGVVDYGGTGLGLSMSKCLVDMMGGEIHLYSQLGHGSTFSVSLLNVTIITDAPPAAIEHYGPSDLSQFLPARLLIIDNHKENCDFLQSLFSDSSLETIVTDSDTEALELCKQQHFDLVFVDIYMPVIDDYQTIRKIQALAGVRIIALTRSDMKDEFDLIRNEYFDSYLRCPASMQELAHVLSKSLSLEDKDLPVT
ncbi:MAG: transporter substrate-binding domain-containing protein [Methyloprofundus sp.]|nr:transporter substrate-binding domain-containing protein [Methyloprofundus sp.]